MPKFLPKKNATSKIIKKSLENQFPAGVLVFWAPAPCPKLAPPKGHFWWYLRCFMHIKHSSKIAVLLPPGGGRRHMARPPIAKAKATPHACGSICPASDALCIAGFKGWRLTAGRRPKGTMLALCWPLLDLSQPYVAPMCAYVRRMLARVGPMLA